MSATSMLEPSAPLRAGRRGGVIDPGMDPFDPTGSRRDRRIIEAGRPGRAGEFLRRIESQAALVDAAFTAALLWVAGLGWTSSYDGRLPLLGWFVGVAIGIAVEALARGLAARGVGLVARVGVRLVGLLGAAVLVAPVFGRAPGISPVGPTAWSGALSTAVGGWRELLTTLPKLDSHDPLGALPYLLGLLLGWVAYAAARSRRGSVVPSLIVLGSLAAVAALGTLDRPHAVLRGIAVVLGLLSWAALRRTREVARNSAAAVLPVAVAVALALVASAVAAPLAQGVGGATVRHTLREQVRPPVTPLGGASLLAGYRRFRPIGGSLADAPLLTVTGLPAGIPLRLSVLDCYSGTVWAACGTAGAVRPGAGGSFWKVGAIVPMADPKPLSDYRVRIEKAYAEDAYLRDWVPSAGALRVLSYDGDRRDDLERESRVNPDTGAGVVNGFHEGDQVVASAGAPDPRVPGQAPELGDGDVEAPGDPAPAAYVTRWGGTGADPWSRLVAAATHLRDTGAYSDGDADADVPVLAGHSLGRIAPMFTAEQPAGDDEQYAAAVALMARSLGLPSRVVVGAVPDGTGVIRGRDIRAWVEIVGDQTWAQLPPDAITPPRDRKPHAKPTVVKDGAASAIVPPPNTSRRPSSDDPFAFDAGQGGADRWSTPAERLFWQLPYWARVSATAVGVPLGVWLTIAGLILAAKALRRSRRRRRAAPAAAVAGAWDEVLDRLTDLRQDRRRGRTRQEQADGLDDTLAALAARADEAQFGPDTVSAEDAAAFWAQADAARRELAAPLPWWRRALARVSPRSLLPGAALGPRGAVVPPSVDHDMLSGRPVRRPEVTPGSDTGGAGATRLRTGLGRWAAARARREEPALVGAPAREVDLSDARATGGDGAGTPPRG